MYNTIEEEENRRVATMGSEQHHQEQETPEHEASEQLREETIHIHYYPDAIVMVKEDEDIAQEAIETTLASATNHAEAGKALVDLHAIGTCLFGLVLFLSCIAFQVYLLFNPTTATVIIIPTSQTVTLSSTLQLGRFITPITLTESHTVPTTGKGHQDARQATGTVTFYNGLFTSQTVAPGTIFTGSDGIQVITDQTAAIPAGNPPSYGQVTVSAHAIIPGGRGNIPAYDILQTCCANAVLVKNTTPFHGGKDERDFQAVAKSDIDTAVTLLNTTLAQGVAGAFQGQLRVGETLYILPCAPMVSSDHQTGEEATRIKVAVSETCSAVAFNKDALQAQSTALLTTQATQQVGPGYILVGAIHVTIRQATVTHTTPTLVFSCQGVWVYGVTNAQQQVIKRLIAGKTKQQALHTLAHMPGIVQAMIEDVDGKAKLPRNPGLIHLVILERLGSQP